MLNELQGTLRSSNDVYYKNRLYHCYLSTDVKIVSLYKSAGLASLIFPIVQRRRLILLFCLHPCLEFKPLSESSLQKTTNARLQILCK